MRQPAKGLDNETDLENTFDGDSEVHLIRIEGLVSLDYLRSYIITCWISLQLLSWLQYLHNQLLYRVPHLQVGFFGRLLAHSHKELNSFTGLRHA